MRPWKRVPILSVCVLLCQRAGVSMDAFYPPQSERTRSTQWVTVRSRSLLHAYGCGTPTPRTSNATHTPHRLQGLWLKVRSLNTYHATRSPRRATRKVLSSTYWAAAPLSTQPLVAAHMETQKDTRFTGNSQCRPFIISAVFRKNAPCFPANTHYTLERAT